MGFVFRDAIYVVCIVTWYSVCEIYVWEIVILNSAASSGPFVPAELVQFTRKTKF